MFVYRIPHVTYFMYVGMYNVYFVMLLACMYMYCTYGFYMALESIDQLEGQHNKTICEIFSISFKGANLIYLTCRVGQWPVDTYRVGRLTLS